MMVVSEDRQIVHRVSLAELTLLFAKVGLMSFGGGMSGLIFREVVIRRGWLTEHEFLSGLAICQVLPGANVVNLAVHVSQRLRGLPGAVSALCGLLIGPFFVVIGFVLVYDRIIAASWVSAALHGVTAAAIGLLLMMVVRGARASRHLGGIAILVVTAASVGVFHLPLIPVVAIVAPVSVLLAFQRRRRNV